MAFAAMFFARTGETMQGACEGVRRLIMIVDDDQALGEMLSILLESEGFKTVVCADGWRAVEDVPDHTTGSHALGCYAAEIGWHPCGGTHPTGIECSDNHADGEVRHDRCGEGIGSRR